MVDAKKSIQLATNWNNVAKEIIIQKTKNTNVPIPDNDKYGVNDFITIEKNITIEFVDIFFNAKNHDKLGDLEIILISPQGTKSILAKQHLEVFDGSFRYDDWRFGSVRHLLENSKGVWKLQIKDLQKGHSGTFISWGLKIYGY